MLEFPDPFEAIGYHTMTFTAAIAFAFAMFIMAIIPGPGVFAITARAMRGDARETYGLIVGIMIGDLIYFTLALMGMASLSQAMGSAFIIVKLLGGAYLVWLGIKMWREQPHTMDSDIPLSKAGLVKNITTGLAVTLTNPKAILFFATLLPTFIDLTAVTTLDALILMAIIIIVGGTTDFFYVTLATRARKLMKSAKAQKLLNRIGGATLMGVGVTVATR